MYSKKRTLNQKITLQNKRIDLPRDAVIDAIFLYVKAGVKNAGAQSWTGKYEDILNAINEIRVVSDGNNVHYALSALDLAVINYYVFKGRTVNPEASITINAEQTANVEFMLTLDIGDIIAIAKDSLELSVSTAGNIAENVTFDSLEITITVAENVMDLNEFTAKYGANLEFSAEPKVYAISKNFSASNELAEVLDLPTGTLLRMAFIITKDTTGARADVEKLGLIITTPDRRELYTVDAKTLKEYNKIVSDCSPLTGIYVVDYGSEITNDVFGIRAWKFNKGDYQLAIKNSSSGSIRYISVEFVVNTAVLDQLNRAVIEASA